jgi:poly-gamma-glutamate biosynthesis protein PgsC/CapC
MEHLLSISIGIGLAVSLIFSELFGLAAGGMVVPGYMALYLTRPIDIALTLGAGLATFLIVHMLGAVMIVYGRRRTVLMILVGYLIGMLGRGFIGGDFPLIAQMDLTFIGYIIPGLIAIWIDRQGLFETFGALLTAAVVVRLILILFVGMEVHK